ncbi:Sensor protein KdpD [uncultured Clostridium sp.]|nr:Sensor protein KdpD [uncultured Clostridium sp.]
MEEFILICAVVFIFILGYFIMRKLDCFLVQNDLQMKEREGLGGECMSESRLNPDELLKVIRVEEENQTRGHLKIFFGYAAGVGKTYAMLKAAHIAKNQGADVVAGYIEPHARPKTAALLNGLELLPVKEIEYNGITLREFDIDAALKRKPQLMLVDELAHTNAQGCRHTKRYQDIKELLNAGIDVYTTVNVQHIESLCDVVASITEVFVRERIPDSLFDNADQVELVDIEPQELIDRLNAGNVYREAQAKQAVENFFTVENLTALREIALRRCADRVNILTENTRVKRHGDYHTDEHILVCLSSSPSNAKIIRTAARMAAAFKGTFTALFVETPDFSEMNEENVKRLRANMRLAEQLGAQIETVYGEDVPFQIAEFARLSGVSKVVIGRSFGVKRHLFSKPTLTERLIANAPNLDVHIIPDTVSNAAVYRLKKGKKRNPIIFSAADILKCIAILLVSSLIGTVFHNLGFAEANIITVYVLGVLITAVITKHQIYGLISSIVSVLVFNFLFTDPKFTLQAYDQGYPVTFLIMFLAAFLTGSLAIRLKNQAKQSARSAYRTKVLFDTNQLLQQSKDRKEIISVTSNQLIKLLGKDIVFYLADMEKLEEPHIFPAANENLELYTSDNEKAVADWVFKNNKRAGATTETLSSAKCLYLAVRVNNVVYGVIGIVMGEEPLDPFENSILLSIIGECALALENEKNAREKEEAAVLAKNEQLRANLLRAISHDLRTPLTSISGNASNLLSNGDSFDEDTKKRLYTDIYDDSMWLIGLVENLLAVTRIEEGRLNLHISEDLLDDVITEALHHINRKSVEHHITVENEDEFLLAKMDAKLIVQVIINLVDNAVKYTPKNSHIKIKTEKHGGKAVVSVADDGGGIPDEMKPRVFDMFYSGANQIVDSRRSLGLGLSLCKSIINAHGGEITVSDNLPHGTVFTFTLPIGEVKVYE